jgi:hypothetical protein
MTSLQVALSPVNNCGVTITSQRADVIVRNGITQVSYQKTVQISTNSEKSYAHIVVIFMGSFLQHSAKGL